MSEILRKGMDENGHWQPDVSSCCNAAVVRYNYDYGQYRIYEGWGDEEPVGLPYCFKCDRELEGITEIPDDAPEEAPGYGGTITDHPQA